MRKNARIPIRLPAEAKTRIAQLASERHLSMNNFITCMLYLGIDRVMEEDSIIIKHSSGRNATICLRVTEELRDTLKDAAKKGNTTLTSVVEGLIVVGLISNFS